ncbi:MAG TPA: glycosyltransferase [Gaiellaceae bacterium]|nr:glycosyltransferase [Gaiellaceae bacterium]
MTDLTVIIPTYNRAGDLRRCLDALALQTAPPETFEVVVVDDGSADGTPALLASYAAPYRLVVERQSNRGQPAALNRGLRAAASAYCLFVDDDIVASRQLVAEHARAQEELGGAIVLGSLALHVERRRSGLARHFSDWWARHYERLDQGVREADFWSCYSGNLSAPTAALRAAGGFDESLQRSFDIELAYRLVSGGLHIAYRPAAHGEQRYEKGFRKIVRDFDRVGEAAALLYKRHPMLAEYPPLGDFSESGSRRALLRRVLLALRVPVWPLALVDPLLARRPPRQLYDFLQEYCYWRGLRRRLDRDTWRGLTKATLILAYHAVARPGERASRFVVTPRRLKRQLAWLRFRRRPVLSLDEYVALRREHRLPPAGSVLLTFDDGYADVKEFALPILRALDLPAALFLVSGAMGDANRWDSDGVLAGREVLAWEDAAALPGAGVTLGAHTVSHARLTDVEPERAEHEIEGSRAQLEEGLRVGSIRHFSYPYGKTSQALAEIVAAAGFDSAYSSEPGTNGPAVPLHNLRRLEVFGTWPLARFALAIWLTQPLFKPRRRPSRL